MVKTGTLKTRRQCLHGWVPTHNDHPILAASHRFLSLEPPHNHRVSKPLSPPSCGSATSLGYWCNLEASGTRLIENKAISLAAGSGRGETQHGGTRLESQSWAGHRQKDHTFEASLGYTVSLCVKKRKTPDCPGRFIPCALPAWWELNF